MDKVFDFSDEIHDYKLIVEYTGNSNELTAARRSDKIFRAARYKYKCGE